MDEKSFLDQFWFLGSADEKKRKRASENILSALKRIESDSQIVNAIKHADEDKTGFSMVLEDTPMEEPTAAKSAGNRTTFTGVDFRYRLPRDGTIQVPAKVANTLEYTVNRLLHGLCSGRECVRLGYGTTLMVVLSQFSHIVPLTSVADAMHQCTTAKHIPSSEAREYLLGRVMGYFLLMEAGYFKSKKSATQLETVIEDLISVMDSKMYLGDAAARPLVGIVLSSEAHSPKIALRALEKKFSQLLETLKRLQSGEALPVLKDTTADASSSMPVGYLLVYMRLWRRWSLTGGRSTEISVKRPLILKKDPLMFFNGILALLSHSATLYALHPQVPEAWQELVACIMELESEDKIQTYFRDLICFINTQFFTVPTVETAHQTNGTTTLGSGTSFQKMFSGFRLMVDALAALKMHAVRASIGNGGPAVETLVHCSDAYWSCSSKFCEQLLFHSRGSKATPLRSAACTTLTLIAQILMGTQGSVRQGVVSADFKSYGLRNVAVYKIDSVFENPTSKAAQQFLEACYSAPPNTWEAKTASIALSALAEASHYARLDPEVYTRLVEIGVSPRTPSDQQKWIKEWFNPRDTVYERENGINIWAWRIELATVAAASTTGLSPDLKAELGAAVLCSVLTTLTVTVSVSETPMQSHHTTLPLIYSFGDGLGSMQLTEAAQPQNCLPVIRAHWEALTLDARKDMARRVLSRLGPMLGKVWAPLHVRRSAESTAKIVLEQSLAFLQTFLVPLVNHLRLLYGDLPGAADVTANATTFLAAVSAVRDTQDGSTPFRKAIVLTPQGDVSVCVGPYDSSVVLTRLVRICSLFSEGVVACAVRLQQTLENLSQWIPEDKNQATTTEALVEFLAALMRVSSLVIHPLILSIPGTLEMQRNTSDDDMASHVGKEDVEPLVNLLFQISEHILGDLLQASDRLTKRGKKKEKGCKLSILKELEKTCREAHVAIVELLPSLLLDSQVPLSTGSQLTTESNADGTLALCRATSQGLFTAVLGPLWRVGCQHASEECIGQLIEALTGDTLAQDGIKDEEASDSDEEDQQMSSIQSNGVSCSEDDGSQSGSIEEEEEKTLRNHQAHKVNEDSDDGAGDDDEGDDDEGDDDEGDEDDEDDAHDEDEEVQGENVAQFLLDENNIEGMEELMGKSSDMNDRQQSRRLSQHQLVTRMHYELRTIEMIKEAISATLDGVMLSQTLNVDDVGGAGSASSFSIKTVLRLLQWLTDLFGLYKLRINRVLRKSHSCVGAGKRDVLNIESSLCGKLETFLSRTWAKLAVLLNTVSRKSWNASFPITTREDWLSHLKTLREMALSIMKQAIIPLADLGRKRAALSQKCEEAEALGLLVLGATENFLLAAGISLFKGDDACWEAIKELNRTESIALKFSEASGLLRRLLETENDVNAQIFRETSGSVLLDLLTPVVYAWARLSHPPKTERFFRSLTSQYARCFQGQTLTFVALLPLVAAACGATKPFVTREALAVHSEIQSIMAKELFMPNNRKFSWNVPAAFIKRAQKWLTLWDATIHSSSLKHMETSAPSAVAYNLKGTFSSTPELKGLLCERSLTTLAAADKRSSSLALAGAIVEESCFGTALALQLLEFLHAKESTATPIGVLGKLEAWKSLTKHQRLALEQQTIKAIHRYSVVLETAVSTDVIFLNNPTVVKELKSLPTLIKTVAKRRLGFTRKTRKQKPAI